LVVRCQSAAMPPVARIRARAESASGSPWRGRSVSPAARPSWRAMAVAASGSSTRMRSCVAARAESARVMRRPVAAPPACTTLRCECPPSSPSARLPPRSASNCTPSLWRSRTRSGDSSQSTRTALARAASRPAAIVSSACWAGESPAARAAAMPPWAQ
jgi:hypothetical protein